MYFILMVTSLMIAVMLYPNLAIRNTGGQRYISSVAPLISSKNKYGAINKKQADQANDESNFRHVFAFD